MRRSIMCICWLAGLVAVTLASPPNVLLIVSEDNGPELGCYGEPYVHTPHLDRLAAEGVRFSRAYVPQAGCSQSRAALLTGLFPHQNGQLGLATWKFHLYREDTPNLVRLLQAQGYRTGIIGKLHVSPRSAFPFDVMKKSSSNFSRAKLGEYAQFAREFLASTKERPFLLSVNYPDAHRPFLPQVDQQPAKPLRSADVRPLQYFGLDAPELRQQTADYYNCLTRLDALVGDLIAELEASGKRENTLVIYLGDHGADLLRGKRTSYEGGVRVPLIVWGPAHVQGGQVRDELVSTLDILPTLLSLAETKPPAPLPGRSLLPLLRGESVDWRKYLFTEFHLHSAHNFYPQRTVRGERYKLIQNLLPGEENPGYQFTLRRFFPQLVDVIAQAPPEVRDAYRRMRQPPAWELYDLAEDPHEFRNLATSAAHRDVLQELQQVLAAWRRDTSDPLLSPAKLRRLREEVYACFEEGQPRKDRLRLTYEKYFFPE